MYTGFFLTKFTSIPHYAAPLSVVDAGLYRAIEIC